MAFNYSPKIVTDGLVLYLDAANIKSYVSGSTTWSNIVGANVSGSLINGPIFNIANAGSIVFDGSNDYMDFYAPNLGGTATVEMWANISTSNNRMMFGWLTYDAYVYNGSLGYNTGNSDVYGIPAATVTSLGLNANWKHYVFEMRSDVSYINNKIYINAVTQSLSQILGSESAPTRTFNNGNGRLSGWRSDTAFPISMNCALFKVYNRALSATEILQNYNATKTRFGL